MSGERRCFRCGKVLPWITAMEVHAACYFTPEQQDALYARYAADPKVTQHKLAADLGVTLGVVLASIHAAKQRLGLCVGSRR